jgi:ketosteroid isomerase-like protein
VDDTEFDVIDPCFLRGIRDRAFAAWNAHDGEALAALCTEDIEWIDAAVPEPPKGRAEVAQFVRFFFAMLPDGRIDPIGEPAISLDGRTAYQPWRLTGTNTGPIDPPGFAATGKPVDFFGVDQYRLRGGLLARYRTFYDRVDGMTQLGLLPSRNSRGERAMVTLQRLGSWLRGK